MANNKQNVKGNKKPRTLAASDAEAGGIASGSNVLSGLIRLLASPSRSLHEDCWRYVNHDVVSNSGHI